MQAILNVIGVLGYIIIGIVQWFALFDFFNEYLDWWWLFAGIAGILITYIPLLGSILGIIAAVKVWHWEVWQAILLFFWPTALMFAIYGLGIFSELIAYLIYQKDKFMYKRAISRTEAENANGPQYIAAEYNEENGIYETISKQEQTEFNSEAASSDKSFLAKLRHGEYSLAKTFWLYSMLVFFAVGILGSLIANHSYGLARKIGAEELMTIWLVLVLLSFLYGINAYLGIWRAATKYTGFVVWKYLAKAIVCFWWVTSTLSVISFLDTYLGFITR